MAERKKCNTAKKSTAVVRKSAPNASKPKSSGARSVQKVPAKQVVKRSSQKGTSVAVTGDLFRGAQAIEITEGAISVTHTASRSRKGSFEKSELRRYVPQTPETIAAANDAIRQGKVKKVRVEFKK